MTGPPPSAGRLLEHLKSCLPQLRREPRWLPSVEATFETLYTLCPRDGSLSALWQEASSLAKEYEQFRVWALLAELGSSSLDDDDATEALLGALSGAPAFSAFVTITEGARLLLGKRGASEAWEILSRADACGRLRHLAPVADLQRDGPLLCKSCCMLLELAARSGDWMTVMAVRNCASAIWPEGSQAFLEIGFASANADLLRGNHAHVLSWTEQWAPSVRDADRAVLLCIKLHALLALGAARERVSIDTLEEYLELHRSVVDEQGEQMQGIHDQMRRLVASDRGLARIFKHANEEQIDRATAEWSVERLFAEEAVTARDVDPPRRAASLRRILERVETLLTNDAWKLDTILVLRLRMMWCRLVLSLAEERAFGSAESILGRIIERAHALQIPELEMGAYDLRGMIRARMDSPNWAGMMTDAAAAAAIAVRLLAENAVLEGGAPQPRRSFLESLLPVFDRVIENHVTGALGLRQAPEFKAHAVDPYREALVEEHSIHGSWQRFGRTVHAYAERAQSLSLDGARRARGANAPFPRTFIPHTDVPRVVIDELRASLSPEDAVIQYFLVGKYVLTFAYGTTFFSWNAERTEDATSAEESVATLLEALGGWVKGENADAPAPEAMRLRRLLLQNGMDDLLARAGTRHLRIVPHGALYRVPFGRLELPGSTLGDDFSISLHPTGALAAASSAPLDSVIGRPAAVAHVVGPEVEHVDVKQRTAPVDCAADDRRALEAGIGRICKIGMVTGLEAWKDGRVRAVEKLPRFDVLHFTCHGRKSTPLKPGGGMILDDGPSGELDVADIAQLALSGCSLVVLQSCWTGWVEHTRSNPVQGVPQAFCDAGAAAVIAPLTDVPMALAPVFSEVLYRVLRFCPAEVALKKTMDMLGRYGALLVSGSPAAEHAYGALGGDFRRVDYRYTGKTGIRIGGWLSRLAGRLSFWFFERSLARRRLHSISRPLSPVSARG